MDRAQPADTLMSLLNRVRDVAASVREWISGVFQPSIPYIPQMTATECGVACLAMVLHHHGRQVYAEELRGSLDAGRDGVNAFHLIEAARKHGLVGQGVSAQLEDLAILPPGSILHWAFDHFVVLERTSSKGVVIVDPAVGRCVVPWALANTKFTGIALIFDPAADFATQTVTARWRELLRALVKANRRQLGRVAALGAAYQLLVLCWPIATILLLDVALPSRSTSMLWAIGAGAVLLGAATMAANFLRSMSLIALRTQFDQQLYKLVVSSLLHAPFEFSARRSAGDLLGRLNSLGSIRDFIATTLVTLLVDAAYALMTFVALAIYSPLMAVICLAIAAIQTLIVLAARHRRLSLAYEAQLAAARTQTNQVEAINGLEMLKASGREDVALSRWLGLVSAEIAIANSRGQVDAVTEPLLSSIRSTGVVVLSIGAAWSVLQGQVSLGQMMAFVALAQGVLGPYQSVLAAAGRLNTVTTQLDRLDELLRTPPEDQSLVDRPNQAGAPCIQVESLSVSYAANVPPVLNDVSFEVQAGEFVAVVGASGSGKSTLVRALLGLLKPHTGRVMLWGVDLMTTDPRRLRRDIGYVSQVTPIFSDTIRGNIAFGLDIPLSEVEAAARLACIAEMIERLPMGYETVLSQRGGGLSGGQLQRVALARALCFKPALLICDEATSQLDTVTEQQVFANLAGLDCTRVVVAHRLSTVVNADRIFVLHDGCLVEAGSHQQLTSRGGHYANLVAAQLRS